MAGVRGFVLFARMVRSVPAVTASGLLAWPVAAESRTVLAASGTSSLTCFGTDVSGSSLVAAGGKPPSHPGPVFVRQQVVELGAAEALGRSAALYGQTTHMPACARRPHVPIETRCRIRRPVPAH